MNSVWFWSVESFKSDFDHIEPVISHEIDEQGVPQILSCKMWRLMKFCYISQLLEYIYTFWDMMLYYLWINYGNFHDKCYYSTISILELTYGMEPNGCTCTYRNHTTLICIPNYDEEIEIIKIKSYL